MRPHSGTRLNPQEDYGPVRDRNKLHMRTSPVTSKRVSDEDRKRFYNLRLDEIIDLRHDKGYSDEYIDFINNLADETPNADASGSGLSAHQSEMIDHQEDLDENFLACLVESSDISESNLRYNIACKNNASEETYIKLREGSFQNYKQIG